MTGRVILRVSRGDAIGQEWEFDGYDRCVVGRAKDCHARLPETDDEVSRHHFILEVNPPDVTLRDLGSLNTTIVNDVQHGGRPPHETPEEARQRRDYLQVPLNSGDRIRAGRTEFELVIETPILCANPDCAAEIPESLREQCRKPDGTFQCPSCRTGKRTSHAEAVPRGVRCDRCGKEVTNQARRGRTGAYTCQQCRDGKRVSANEAAVIVAEAQEDESYGGIEVERFLADGGQGEVYLAKDRHGAHVALKLMHSNVPVDSVARGKFLREIEVMKSLTHPNVVRLIDHGCRGGTFYFVMEYCDGGSLQDLLDNRGRPISEAEVLPIAMDVLEGMAHAHDSGYIHRDLKPGNLLLASRPGGRQVAKVTDFGLAKSFELAGFSGQSLTRGLPEGTIPFMPKEQIINFKYVKPTSDIWALGATFYYLLTNEFPRDFPPGMDPYQVILRGHAIPIRKRSRHVSRGVADVIDRSLAFEPQDRFPSAREFLNALRRVC